MQKIRYKTPDKEIEKERKKTRNNFYISSSYNPGVVQTPCRRKVLKQPRGRFTIMVWL